MLTQLIIRSIVIGFMGAAILSNVGCQTTMNVSVSEASGYESINFGTYSPDSLVNIVENKWKVKAKEISGRLYLPAGTEKVPAVIVYHGSGHVKNLGAWVSSLSEKMNDVGIAVFAIDSYTMRGINSTSSDQSKLTKATRVVDAFSAMEALRKHNRIDPTKIGITGYSFGGIVSLLAVDRKLSDPIVGEGNGFAASLPVYPSCITTWQNPTPTDAPVLILAGEADDYTWAKYCVEYVGKMKNLGYKVDIKVYPNAHHGWINTKNGGYNSKDWKFNKCGPSWIEDDGNEVAMNGKISTKTHSWKEIIGLLVKNCAKRGTTTKYQKEASLDTLERNVNFFSKHLQ